MNWHWNPHQSSIDLYDHNGDLIRENIEFEGSWTGNYPDKVNQVMIDILRERANFNNSPVLNPYAGKILIALL